MIAAPDLLLSKALTDTVALLSAKLLGAHSTTRPVVAFKCPREADHEKVASPITVPAGASRFAVKRTAPAAEFDGDDEIVKGGSHPATLPAVGQSRPNGGRRG